MRNYIQKADLNILNGVLAGEMEFLPGLNIISGENGTLKTQLLLALRSGASRASVPGQTLRMQSISPKRNSERRASEAILQYFRQNNRTWETSLNERVAAQINVSGFDNYPSLGELYYLMFDHQCKDGADRIRHMQAVADDFNKIVQAVFPQYEVVPTWDQALGAPRISMSKHGGIKFPIESLSMGEQEVLSLVVNIRTSADRVDVYLIDEPEVHLNWHLEERLFGFLDDLCNQHQKQAIVVTHSRTIFKPKYLSKTQFLRWAPDGKVEWSKELTPQQRSRLAGDAVEFVALGDYDRPTIFVEDDRHEHVVQSLARSLGSTVRTSPCGNSTNVKSLFRYQLTQGRWAHAFFMIDGDNQGDPFPLDPQFIHLPYYCIDNAFLDPRQLSNMTGRGEAEVRRILVQLIKAKRREIFQKNRFFEFLADSLSADHMTFDRLKLFDASEVVADLAQHLGYRDLNAFTDAYLASANRAGALQELFPKRLLAAIETEKSAVQSDTSSQDTNSAIPSEG